MLADTWLILRLVFKSAFSIRCLRTLKARVFVHTRDIYDKMIVMTGSLKICVRLLSVAESPCVEFERL